MLRHAKPQIYLFILLPLLLTACATLPLSDRISQAQGFEKAHLKTKYFTLTSFYRFTKPGQTLNIYIEGDGSAWLSRSRLSSDPTPKNPLVLELASIDSSPNVAYLARPGQYTEQENPKVDSAHWSNKRFSEEVISSMSEAIGQLAFRVQANKINLIGYSGGAAVAILIAARRSDIMSLRTIAGNLNPEAVNRYHKVSTLSGSLNPIDFAKNLKGLPQRHFIGSKDTIIPSFIAESFLKAMGDTDYSRITVVKGATHSKGWRRQWKELLEYPPN